MIVKVEFGSVSAMPWYPSSVTCFGRGDPDQTFVDGNPINDGEKALVSELKVTDGCKR